MPPKQFLSSKTADIWNDRKPSAPPEKKRKKDDRNEVDDIDLRVTGEHLRQLVQRGAARSERSSLAQELTDMKKLKGTNQAKPFNYADLQKKQKKLKELEREQQERDKELGGGSAIIQRTKQAPKKQKQKVSLREIGMKDGAVVVGKRTIQANSSKRSKVVL